MKNILRLVALSLVLLAPTLQAQSSGARLYYDRALPQVQFGADEITAELAKTKIPASSDALGAFRAAPNTTAIVLAATREETVKLCRELALTAPAFKKSQAYAIRKKSSATGTTIAVLAADATGAMYGAPAP